MNHFGRLGHCYPCQKAEVSRFYTPPHGLQEVDDCRPQKPNVPHCGRCMSSRPPMDAEASTVSTLSDWKLRDNPVSSQPRPRSRRLRRSNGIRMLARRFSMHLPLAQAPSPRLDEERLARGPPLGSTSTQLASIWSTTFNRRAAVKSTMGCAARNGFAITGSLGKLVMAAGRQRRCPPAHFWTTARAVANDTCVRVSQGQCPFCASQCCRLIEASVPGGQGSPPGASVVRH